ncbi:Calcium-dependent lipid-binding-like protein [Arachis hypogaea]|nr:Calcium-dependent lipid-binding-like protein [Arachis hypogaea]
MYRHLRALSRRCRRLELAAELLHRLQAVTSPLISSLSLLNTIVFEGVYDFDSDDELQWLIEIQKESVELQEFSLGSCPPSMGLQGMRWSTIVDQYSGGCTKWLKSTSPSSYWGSAYFYLHQSWMEKHFCIHLYPEWPGVSSWLNMNFGFDATLRNWKAFCESHSRAMAVVVAVIARGGGYRGGRGGGDGACYSCGGRYNGGGGGGSYNNCGYSGLLQGTAQQALAENIEKVTRRAQEQFQMVLEEKSRFVFDVDLDSPIVRIPLRSHGSTRCDSHFLLDFGQFTLHTAVCCLSCGELSCTFKLWGIELHFCCLAFLLTTLFGLLLYDLVFLQESQSDKQRHNLYSRFYIPGRDFAAFFTDCGSDFGSCSLVKPTHESQIISSPRAKEADNVYSVIDRCGMAVLVNQIKVPHPSYPSTCISIQVPNL